MFKPGLLDRLTDRDIDVSGEAGGQRWSEWLDALMRDLRDLMNTRRFLAGEALAPFPEARKSLMAYGLPELGSYSGSSPEARRRMAGFVEAAIRQFEPRLMSVQVQPWDDAGDGREVRFRVMGYVQADPMPQRVLFDTALHLDRQECRVVAGEESGSTP